MSMNDAPPRGGSGKKWTIIALVVVLVAALGVGGYLFVNKKNDTASASTSGEVFLTAAADPGQDPFSNASFAAPADTSVALAATSATPASQAASVTASSGGEPGLYGGTNNLVSCDADKMVAFLQANPDKANAWVKALNDDPNLRYDGGTLTTASIPAYLATLTPIVLVSDTRVTNHGFANGNPTELQSVLQKGTAVFVDKYGVPRVRCACGNPLAAPKATKSGPKYRGKAWGDFSVSKLRVVQANGQTITTFQIRVPAKPTGTLARLPVGPFACVPTAGNTCKTPSGVSKLSPTGTPGASASPTPPATSVTAPPTKPSSSVIAQSSPPKIKTSGAAPRTSSAPTTPNASATIPGAAGPSKKQGTITIGSGPGQNGNTRYTMTFDGYTPYSTVHYMCVAENPKTGSAESFFSYDQRTGKSGGASGAYCNTNWTGFHVVDQFGKSFFP